MKSKKSGFTLIEMLVVMGVIAVLSGALMMGFGRMTKTAQRARAVEAVSNAAQALGILRQMSNNRWPSAILTSGGSDGTGKGMVVNVAKVLADKKLMSVSRNENTKELIGISRCGVVDPWAEAVLKRNVSANESTRVPSGGTVQSHIIYYAVDEDGDGITEASVNGQAIKVRAEAIAWCAGYDGVLAPYAKRGRSDDVYSWDPGKEVKR